ncbi:MAG: peroxide stress protein YaaA [Flavobacteriales bacterium]|nr:peroxide stress protein YaaA [Flavobacteriales bacterium]
MLIVLSPAKKLDFETAVCTEKFTVPKRLDRSEQLINKLQRISKKQIRELMDLSNNLAELNIERYKSWNSNFSPDQAKQALLAFKGDVYQGMENETLTADDLNFSQEHLRILSGLHGLLRPLDLIKPYRLEMGTKLSVGGKKNLYQFWGSSVAEDINSQLQKVGSNVLLNLASNEYFKVIDLKVFNGRIITPVFKDMKNGQLKVRFLYAKQARGMMTSYILRNRIVEPEELKSFTGGGYRFTQDLSDTDTWVFTR